jgi:hypothetical protein
LCLPGLSYQSLPVSCDSRQAPTIPVTLRYFAALFKPDVIASGPWGKSKEDCHEAKSAAHPIAYRVKVHAFVDWVWNYFSQGGGPMLRDRSDATRITWYDDDGDTQGLGEKPMPPKNLVATDSRTAYKEG